jgi:hypothetical protein
MTAAPVKSTGGGGFAFEDKGDNRPEGETHHAARGEETHAEARVGRLRASDRRPVGWRAADQSPPITSKRKTSQSSEATPIRLRNVDAIKTPRLR